MTRRTSLALLAATLSRAATKRLPTNKNIKWAVSIALWNGMPNVRFTDILDIMHDTGFIGIRLKALPEMLKTYDITAAQIRAECEKRGCHVITISFNGATHDPARHKD